jgi:hypothetical protein
LTPDERIRAVMSLDLTERQAGFLVVVMLHAGVCVGRQYCTYSRIAYGQKMHDFFRLLLARGYATARPSGKLNARIWHIHHKPLYRLIGEPDNRHRRGTTLPRAIERLMVLDAVLADPNRVWMATERDKLAHFTLTRGVPERDLPRLVFRSDDTETVRYFPDKLPVGIDADGDTLVFLYLATSQVPIAFRAFLERHAELLRALRAWRLRLLFPRHLATAIPGYKAAFHEHLATPLRPVVLEELRWYFGACRARVSGPDMRFDHAARAFAAPRFRALYRAWLEHGNAVLDATLSPVLADAIRRRTAQLECHALPHQYLHLFPLVGTA